MDKPVFRLTEDGRIKPIDNRKEEEEPEEPEEPKETHDEGERDAMLQVLERLDAMEEKMDGLEAMVNGMGGSLIADSDVDKIERLTAMLEEKTPEGEQKERYLTVTSDGTDLNDLDWYNMLVMVDGPGDVYVGVNDRRFPSTPLKPGDRVWMDFGKKGAIKRVRLLCDAGDTSEVRILALK